MGGVTPIVPPPIPAELDLRRKPLLARRLSWVVIGAAILAGGAFWMGSHGSSRRTPTSAAGNVNIVRPPPQSEMLDLAIQSNPSGAEVFIAGEENESIGKTPFRKKFEYREDKTLFLLFRLAGYRDLTHEVRPDWSGLVVLDPVPAQSPPVEVSPANPSKPTKSGTVSKSGRRKVHQGGKNAEATDHGKGIDRRAENPF
jgi:hypothetical protein